MSKQQAWNLGKVIGLIAGIAATLTGVSLLAGWAGKGVDLVRVPERTATVEHRLDSLEQLVTTNFMSLHRDNEDRRHEFQELRELIRSKN
jgi:hypothetical protein